MYTCFFVFNLDSLAMFRFYVFFFLNSVIHFTDAIDHKGHVHIYYKSRDGSEFIHISVCSKSGGRGGDPFPSSKLTRAKNALNRKKIRKIT